jgi:hypothetical protein
LELLVWDLHPESRAPFFLPFSPLKQVVMMIFQQQTDLIERKRALGWTNREVANVLGVAPGVASSKLNGFIILTVDERRRLELAMAEAERRQAEQPAGRTV